MPGSKTFCYGCAGTAAVHNLDCLSNPRFAQVAKDLARWFKCSPCPECTGDPSRPKPHPSYRFIHDPECEVGQLIDEALGKKDESKYVTPECNCLCANCTWKEQEVKTHTWCGSTQCRINGVDPKFMAARQIEDMSDTIRNMETELLRLRKIAKAAEELCDQSSMPGAGLGPKYPRAWVRLYDAIKGK